MQSNSSAIRREEVRTFWTGPVLSYYEILSLKSFVATGARVLVYSYEKDLNVPEGVELADAGEILSGAVHEFRHANGDKSLALHSDLFRYAALQRYGGWYADLDIICLKDRLPDAKTYFAFETGDLINAAIIKFPERTAFMDITMSEAWTTLPEAGAAFTNAARLSIGPNLFTRIVHEQGMDHLALPQSRAYEIKPAEMIAFFDPARCNATMERLADSDFTHLWNEIWRMMRIPKNFGPPEGSFLDAMFKRFDIDIPARARLQIEAIDAWMREHRFLDEIKGRLGIDRIGEFTVDEMAYAIQTFGWKAHGHIANRQFVDNESDRPKTPKYPQARDPQTLRTFWQGDFIGPYQLLCLRSFVEHGHRVEVFSYNLKLIVPAWLTLRDAEEILPQDEVLRPIQARTVIDGGSFRWALLQKLGGWWIDPDMMLLKPDLPEGDLFFGNLDAFGVVPTSVLKFPAGHRLLDEALNRLKSLDVAKPDSNFTDSEVLTALVRDHGLDLSVESEKSLGPISWFNVLDLFNPARAVATAERIANERFLQLHDDVWRRAGIDPLLAAPESSYLDALFARYDIGARFPARMHFHQVNRWVSHMYKCVQIDRGTI